MNKNPITCSLCQEDRGRNIETKNNHFFLCNNCGLISKRFPILSSEEEKKHYNTHENIIGDRGYQAFLNRLAVPFLKNLKPNASILDYGCGPGPELAQIFKRAGHKVCVYDPYFKKDPDVLNQQYDAISCTEVVEHFNNPEVEFHRFNQLLQDDGYLGIMTTFYNPTIEFNEWYYHRDPTHVAFYQTQTFDFIAKRYNWQVNYPAKNIVIFKKLKA